MQAIGEQMAVVSAALKRVYESAFVTSESAFGVYRGTVVDDVDPRQQERVQGAGARGLRRADLGAGEPPGWCARRGRAGRKIFIATGRRLLDGDNGQR